MATDGGVVGRREENKRRRRERLLAEGLGLMLESGYERTSIEAIAAAAEVARGTFYLYFPDKHALFVALMRRWVDPMRDTIAEVEERIQEAGSTAEVRAAYEAMGESLAAVGLTRSDEILVAFRESRQLGDGGRWLREVELDLLDRAVAFTEVASDRGLIRVADPRLAVLVVFGAVERLFYEALVGTDLGDLDSVAHTVVGLFGATMGFAEPSR